MTENESGSAIADGEHPTDGDLALVSPADSELESTPEPPAWATRPSVRRFQKNRRNLLPESWRVQLPVFEGPLDLLLHLITINEFEISDIPVAVICDQFHEYLNLMEELDLDIAGEYIYEAAVLIQVKSRMLLPQPKTLEGEVIDEDPRQELVERLLEYRRIKEAAHGLAEVDSVRGGLWTRAWQPIDPDPDEEGQLNLDDVSMFDLLKAFRTVLSRYETEHPDPLVFQGEAFNVKDQIRRFLERMQPGRPLDLFDELLAMSCRAEAIAAFLAVLELAKLNAIRLHQTAAGGVLLYRTTRVLSELELETISL